MQSKPSGSFFRYILQHVLKEVSCGMLMICFPELQHNSIMKEAFHSHINKQCAPKPMPIFFGRIDVFVVHFAKFQHVM
jgi:hypothetical protein